MQPAPRITLKLNSFLSGLLFCLTVMTVSAQDEPHNTGWELFLDNDAFSLLNTDQDYTGGFSYSLLGRRAAEYPFSLDGVRQEFDELFGHKRLYSGPRLREQHSMQFGLASFTPKNVAASLPVTNDRPYASLLFIANSYKRTVAEKRIAYHSSFTLGVLGLHIADEVQKYIHEQLGYPGAKGWNNQISEGGELTARYSFSRQKTRAHRHFNNGGSFEVNTMFGGSIGYITDAGIGIFARGGKIHSPWWSFNPHRTENIHIGAPIISAVKESNGVERYFWTGINIKYRAYNALLQGQFRESVHTFSAAELNPWIVETWAGFTRTIGKHYRINITIRASTPELKIGEKRSPVWGSIALSKSI